MAFMSFLGRLLFVFVFLLSACQLFNDFGINGGPAGKSLKPKFDILFKYASSQTGLEMPDVDIKYIVAAAIALKCLGSLLFVCGSSFGAYVLLLHHAFATPILYDFYNYDADTTEYTQLFAKFTQTLALLGALLFFIGMKNSIPRRNRKKAPKSKTT